MIPITCILMIHNHWNNMQTKKEYLKAKSLEYKQLKNANKIAVKLESRIADIRAQGYNLIVLGSKVKITLPK